MSQDKLLCDQGTHRPAQNVGLTYAERVHKAGGVVGKLLDSERTLPLFGISHAPIVENDQLEKRR